MKVGTLYQKINESFLADIKNGETELADKMLSNLGYDIKELDALAEQIYERQRLILDEMIRKHREEVALEKTSSLISQVIKKRDFRLLAKLNELFRENKIIFQQENLKNLTVEEIKKMIRNINYLEILELIDGHNKSIALRTKTLNRKKISRKQTIQKKTIHKKTSH